MGAPWRGMWLAMLAFGSGGCLEPSHSGTVGAVTDTATAADTASAATDTAGTGRACCAGPADCATPGEVCVMGHCLAPPASGRCWGADDCEPGQRCDGPASCPCSDPCPGPVEPGTCVSGVVPSGCCDGVTPCPSMGDELACVGVTAAQLGVCEPPAAHGACWSDADCASGRCEGASVCPCGANCVSQRGACATPVSPACCGDDDDCPSGYACGGAPGSEDGVCKSGVSLEAGQCWGQAHCGAGQWCLGAWVCPCDADCDGEDEPGTCVDMPAGCCVDDAGCDDGRVCRGVSGSTPGRCVADPNGGECLGDAACCWADDDCPGSSSCQGASVCGCVALCELCDECAPEQLGWCQ
ncbi:MAG: hypothetical protein CVU56_17820 [Deltaproteobacteria bacterium HGW-Deltaproteobacteria-14]|jgi:hypothetical protein|nr:MAG: hypothetical protein CVU56_17820 [Deltaproteobacteria bacterium HGW-Deltaproteobacteria-14]